MFFLGPTSTVIGPSIFAIVEDVFLTHASIIPSQIDIYHKHISLVTQIRLICMSYENYVYNLHMISFMTFYLRLYIIGT